MSMNFIKIFSYRSAIKCKPKTSILKILFKVLFVENIGVEPMTSCVQGKRSSQLS